MFGRRRQAQADQLAEALLAARALLEEVVTTIVAPLARGLSPAEVQAVLQVVDAPNDRELLAVVRQHPWLATARGAMAFELLALDPMLLPLLQSRIEDRRAWISQLVEINLAPERMQLPSD